MINRQAGETEGGEAPLVALTPERRQALFRRFAVEITDTGDGYGMGADTATSLAERLVDEVETLLASPSRSP